MSCLKLEYIPIQPNYTHGDNSNEILENMKKLFPKTKSIRTHSLLR